MPATDWSQGTIPATIWLPQPVNPTDPGDVFLFEDGDTFLFEDGDPFLFE